MQPKLVRPPELRCSGLMHSDSGLRGGCSSESRFMDRTAIRDEKSTKADTRSGAADCSGPGSSAEAPAQSVHAENAAPSACCRLVFSPWRRPQEKITHRHFLPAQNQLTPTTKHRPVTWCWPSTSAATSGDSTDHRGSVGMRKPYAHCAVDCVCPALLYPPHCDRRNRQSSATYS